MPAATAEMTVEEHGIPVDAEGRYAFAPKTYTDRKRNVAQILWCLHYDGPFEDHQGGGCTALLNDALAKRRVVISNQVLNVILRDMDHPGARFGHLITRKCPPGGKRTYEIKLRYDPHTVPFPPNPWPHESKAAFEPKGARKPAAELDDHTELEETYTRHTRRNGTGRQPVDVMDRLLEADREIKARAATEPEPEPEPAVEIDEDHAPDDVVAAVEQMIAETPVPEPAPEPTPEPAPEPANGLVPVQRRAAVEIDDDFDISDLGIDLESETGTYASNLTRAIELITNAITIRATEESSRHEDVGLLVDQRMTAYIRLNDENAALRSKLARSLKREQQLLALARQLKATVIQLRGAE